MSSLVSHSRTVCGRVGNRSLGQLFRSRRCQVMRYILALSHLFAPYLCFRALTYLVRLGHWVRDWVRSDLQSINLLGQVGSLSKTGSGQYFRPLTYWVRLGHWVKDWVGSVLQTIN